MCLLKLRNNVLNDIYILITYGVIFMFYYNERLMLARKKRDLTQNELSQRLGLKQQQYPKYQKGINVMPITYLYNAWIVLNISVNYNSLSNITFSYHIYFIFL